MSIYLQFHFHLQFSADGQQNDRIRRQRVAERGRREIERFVGEPAGRDRFSAEVEFDRTFLFGEVHDHDGLFPILEVSRQWNWGDGLSGIRELLLQRIQRIRSAAGAHVEPRETRIFILIFYPGAAPVLRVLRILRSLRILRFCSRTDLFAHPTPVTSYHPVQKKSIKNMIAI